MKSIKKMGQKGFTIVELLIVIVIIGILAALVFVQFNNMQARGRDAERKADIRLIESKLAEYYADEGEYPNPDFAALSALDIPGDALEDPRDSAPHVYTYTSDGETYTLTATLEQPADASEEGDGGYIRQP